MKTTKYKEIYSLVASFAIAFAYPVFAKEKGNGYVLEVGKHLQLCRDMLEILNLPENNHSLGFRTTGKEFTIPKKYKDFEIIQWTPIPKDEVEKYVTPKTLQVLGLLKQQALTIEKDWDGKGDWEFEIAQVNIDGHGKAETMLRYRLPNWKKPSCMLADTESEKYRERFNPSITHNDRLNRDESGEPNPQCQVFKYKNRAYSTWRTVIREPTPLPHWGDEDPYIHADLNVINDVCQFWNPNWKNELPKTLKTTGLLK